MKKLYVEEKEGPLETTPSEAIKLLLDALNMAGVPVGKRRKLIARALLSNCIIEEIQNQINFLVANK